MLNDAEQIVRDHETCIYSPRYLVSVIAWLVSRVRELERRLVPDHTAGVREQ